LIIEHVNLGYRTIRITRFTLVSNLSMRKYRTARTKQYGRHWHSVAI